jgi:hypothetical protein
MSIFMVDPDKLRADAEERLRVATKLLESATETYEGNPTRENLISLKAAVRLTKETHAEFREWDDEA